jgi:hypothetical protein
MPFDEGRWLDDHQRIAPIEKPRQGKQHQAGTVADARWFRPSFFKKSELLSKE